MQSALNCTKISKDLVKEYGRTGNQFMEKGVYFHREPANIRKKRDKDKLFLNRTVPFWNDLPVKVKKEKSLNGFKAELDGLGLFFTDV